MKRLLPLLILAACDDKPASTAPRFELDCAAADTTTASELHCVRTDTRDGDVLVVDYLRLPVSNGSTAQGGSDAGKFTTACAATSTDRRADFYCVRLNTQSGELLLVNLTRVGALPPRKT